MPQATQLLKQAEEEVRQTSANLKVVQKEAIQHNNESLFGGAGAVTGAAAGAVAGSIIPGAGTAVGAVAGLVLGALGASFGADIGKEISHNFDFDVLGWLKGENAKSSAPQADWVTSDGKKFSEHSATEKIQILQDKNELTKKLAAENAVQQQVAEQKHTEGMEAWKNGQSGDFALSQIKKEDIDSAIAANAKKNEMQRLGMNNAIVSQTPVVASMYGDQNSREISKITNGEYGKIIDNEIAYVKSLFTRNKGDKPNHLGLQNEKSENIQDANKIGTDFWSNVGDFFKGVVEGVKNDNKIKSDMIQSNATAPITATEVGNSGLNPVTGQMITPPAVQMSNFNISDMLPDFNLSEWIAEKTVGIDLASMLPDFSGIGETIGTQLDVIPTKISEVASTIGEGFNQIPTAASEAFNTVSTYANEGLTTIQTTWNELPSFFTGIFGGLGGIASSAGSAIASGINSGIGMIKSAWESLSSWLSQKISSLSSMASNAVGAVKGAIGIGHNATGTVSWQGGWTEVNEQGGEIIYLPSGTKIYPHATTMKMLQSEMKAGRFDDLIQPTDELGNLKGYSGMAENLVQVGDLSPVREAKLQKQREEMLQPSISEQTFQPAEISTFPQAISFEEMTRGIPNSSNTTNNNGVTVTGNTFNIQKESDIDKIAFKLMELMTDSHANFAGV